MSIDVKSSLPYSVKQHLTITSSATVKLLIVDDEPDVASILAEGLEYFGYSCEVSYSGEEALVLLESQAFDVLLSDIHMPHMRGDELQKRAREHQPDLAVLLVTAATDISLAVKCFQDGISDYITKPFDLSDVATRIERAIERQRLIRENLDYQMTLVARVDEQAAQIRTMYQESLQALNAALEAKDGYTCNHSARVADMAVRIAIAMHVGDKDPTYIDRLRTAALLHDIGKIGVPEQVLNKPGTLTGEEWQKIQQHPTIGETILRPIFNDPMMLSVVRNHHEQMDGSGYPDNLLGEAIPFAARIIAVADAYDAMTSKRTYREGMSPAQAMEILREGAGKQWDAKIVDVFLDILASESLKGACRSQTAQRKAA